MGPLSNSPFFGARQIPPPLESLIYLGLQSTAFEIWEQYEGILPLRVIVPVGGGDFLEGLYSGLKEGFSPRPRSCPPPSPDSRADLPEKNGGGAGNFSAVRKTRGITSKASGFL